tara:strand:- start:727 stop:1626 length:900 start_codon:yes stop_codon:yes gene_type:complete
MTLVWGSGLEAQPHVLAALARRWDIVGCSVATFFKVNDPRTFSRALAAHHIRTPRFAFGKLPKKGRWLLKHRGSCGGFGVTRTNKPRFPGQREYFQHEHIGVHLSAAFIVSSGSVLLLGVCEALNLQPHPELPYRFSGAIAVPQWFYRLRIELTKMVEKLHDAFTLRGLCGIDFIIDGDGNISLIELNARPPATFGLLAQPEHVFEAHLKADSLVHASLPAVAQVRAMAVCYAERPILVTKTLNWPHWVTDRPRIRTCLLPGMPVCSISAAAATVADTRRKLENRVAELRDRLNNELPN